MTSQRILVAAALLSVAGCGQQLVEFALPDLSVTAGDLVTLGDLPPSPDLAGSDGTVSPDQRPPVDQLGLDLTTTPPDLAGRDLTTTPADLAPPPGDLAPPDLRLVDQATADQVTIADQTTTTTADLTTAPADLATTMDQTAAPADLTSPPPDQTKLPDQVPPADLNLSGPRCHAVLFDGVDALVTSPHIGAYNTGAAITVEAWVYPTKFGPLDSTLVAHWGDVSSGNASYMLQLTATGQPIFHISGLGADNIQTAAAAPLQLNRWTHVAGVFSLLSVFTYVDGVQTSSLTTLTAALHGVSGVPLSIGRLSAASPAKLPFAGYIDEARVSSVARYTGAFTPATSFAPDASTVALYHYDETSGQTASDSAPSANVATLQLNATFASPPVCQ